MTANLSTAMHRSLFALPLLAVALAAAAHEPPALGETLERVVSSTIDCSESPRPAGRLGLARMPGDLGLISRRLHCAG
ncbi:hypothetical protein [Arenimonas terrae]|jgi:hypothetical protein|uniref:Uncharacterized protein n=1 Tax=Arenimonas terrae TaxID=2546226 RepID=A0A5C4RPI2_9GAMM|nr:hypothetical protein [Arenimonas terrae]TNJ33166.1 hypothetical protein E1B00_12760 [Arenimonas terrae]